MNVLCLTGCITSTCFGECKGLSAVIFGLEDFRCKGPSTTTQNSLLNPRFRTLEHSRNGRARVTSILPSFWLPAYGPSQQINSRGASLCTWNRHSLERAIITYPQLFLMLWMSRRLDTLSRLRGTWFVDYSSRDCEMHPPQT